MRLHAPVRWRHSHELNSILPGQVRHIYEHYSRIAWSEENLPIRAMFKIDLRFQRRFRKKRVIGVADRILRNGLGGIPIQGMFVDMLTPQFRNRNRRASIVHLNRKLR